MPKDTAFAPARLLTRRTGFAAVAVIAAGLIGFAVLLQQTDNIEPCPLCILQRYAFALVALSAAAAALLPRRAATVPGIAGVAFALGGAGISTWHVWLQYHPPEVSSCGPGLGYLIGNLPLGRALPRIFQGYGDCTAIDWTFLGLTIPGWALAWLLLLAAGLVVSLRRR
ncbi:MAG TPA: disulfide bond formation protein B [Burkholderiaceae bacterium]